MTIALSSTPSFTEFDPRVIPYQGRVLDDLDSFDYGQGVHELLLSGSVGCLREDALVQTTSGTVPISHITAQDYVLGFDHQKNRFVAQSNSGAFLKGKGNLYRVVTKHGEFVGAGNHRIATLRGNYLSLDTLFAQRDSIGSFDILSVKSPFSGQISLPPSVLHYWNKLVSFLLSCEEYIHQCDQRLHSDLKTVLASFPLQADVQVHGQFSYSSKPVRADVLLEQEQELDRIFESAAHPSMHYLIRLLESKTSGAEETCFYSKLYEQTLMDIQRLQQSGLHGVHPKVLLSFVCKLQKALVSLLSAWPKEYETVKIESIEQAGSDWFFDLQVPNINNYLAHGVIHHNSAKSILMAHAAIRHCVEHERARVCLGRKSMPDLKETILSTILEHLEGDFEEGVDYEHNETKGKITFSNGSEIISRSWSDKKYKRFRSLSLSAAIVEELTENNDEDKQAYIELKMRVGRLPHVKENFVLSATNPDAPSHWAYKYFITSDSDTRHVYYSVTTDNPFLPEWYINQLLRDLDPKMARRMVYGEWLEIASEVIYHQYDRDRNFKNHSYEVNEAYPIHLSFDFNIGVGKPMSACLAQYIDGTFHFFSECVVEGANTEDLLEEMASRDLFNYRTKYFYHGDAAGKHRDTRSKRSDYDIIHKFLSEYRTPSGNGLSFEGQVPLTNPPIRTRHNTVNAHLLNSQGVVRLHVYRDCPVLDEGFRLTRLKQGGQYIEDDSKSYQHVTTAAGYLIFAALKDSARGRQGMVQF